MADKKELEEMAAQVKARAAERAPKAAHGARAGGANAQTGGANARAGGANAQTSGVATASAPAPLGEYDVLNCERENFLGDAKVFQHLHQGKVLYVHQQNSWIRWDAHSWRQDLNSSYTLGLVEDVAQEYLRVGFIFGKEAKEAADSSDKDTAASASKKRDNLFARAKRCRGKDRKAVLDFAASEPIGMSIAGDELDSDPWLRGMKNGVLDLQSGQIRPGRPEDYITLTSPTEWQGPDADAAPFMQFLNDILQDDPEMVAFMLRFLGMALIGRQREHKFLVLFGPGGRNGKDTLMSILTDVLGEQLCSSVPMEMFMEQQFLKDYSKGNPVDLAMRGKLLVYASESSKRHKFSGETMKNLTGGGKMRARALNENYIWSWEKTHTVILLTNELPSAAADDDAFWERLLGVELKRRFVDSPDPEKENERPKDPDLRDKMRACAPGIMAALLRGFNDYMQGGLRPPAVVQSFKESYRQAEDLIGNFLEECCEVYTDEPSREDPLKRTAASQLQQCFFWWFKNNISRKNISPQVLKNGMLKRGVPVRKISGNFYLGVVITQDTLNEWASDREREKEERRGK